MKTRKIENNENALFSGEENNIALWRLAQESKESPLCLPAQVFTHTFENIFTPVTLGVLVESSDKPKIPQCPGVIMGALLLDSIAVSVFVVILADFEKQNLRRALLSCIHTQIYKD